jgi:hypothetical protein
VRGRRQIVVVKKIVFDGYSYRTSSHFGSRVRVSVDDGMVTVTGPRIGGVVYRLWIVAQVILFWSIPPALATGAILRDWRYVAAALVLAVVHWAVGTFGAVCFWELANVVAFTEGAMGQAATFSMSTVKRVKVGRGWARNGLWLAIPLFVPGINQWAEGSVVSFEAPDGETGRDVVYAFQMQTKEDARSLAKLLGRGASLGAKQ